MLAASVPNEMEGMLAMVAYHCVALVVHSAQERVHVRAILLRYHAWAPLAMPACLPCLPHMLYYSTATKYAVHISWQLIICAGSAVCGVARTQLDEVQR
jgi:hypothetical protein